MQKRIKYPDQENHPYSSDTSDNSQLDDFRLFYADDRQREFVVHSSCMYTVFYILSHHPDVHTAEAQEEAYGCAL